MKKAFILMVAVLFGLSGMAFAAGSCVQTISEIDKGAHKVSFVCTGDTDGSIPNTDTADFDTNGKPLNGIIKGLYLTEVHAYPTSGGTAPDPASVFILDENDLDLLGCEDGSTTAYAGLNLIHATLPRSVIPNMYLPRAGNHLNYYPKIKGKLTLKVIDQGTNGADYTIDLIFEE